MIIQLQGGGPLLTYATHHTSFKPSALGDFPPDRSSLMVWANRFFQSITPKDNPPEILIDNKPYRFRFSSLAKANIATIALLRSAFVSFESAKIVCTNNGLIWCEYDDINKLRTLRKTDHFMNVALIHPSPITSKCSSFLLDYEVQDGRSPTQTLNFFNRLRTEFPLLRRGFYTNNLLSASATRSGLSGIEIRLPGIFHSLSILLTNNKFDLAEQRKLYGATPKIITTLDMKQDIKLLTQARDYIEEHSLLGVNIWRNGETDENLQKKLEIFKAWRT